MKVLVYGMVGTNRGGIETFLLKMNQFMSSETVFDYVIEEESCLHEEQIESKGGKIYFITGRTKSVLKNLYDNKKLLEEKRKTHKVVYFNLSSLSWIEPIRIAVKLGYKVFVHSHNSEFVAANCDFIHRTFNYINKKRLSKLNVVRLTCSKPARDFMFQKTDVVEMIYNAIQPEQYVFNETTRIMMREKLKALPNDIIVGFVGRLNDQKNPLYLPEVMKEIVGKNDNIKMLIIGDGPMKEQLVNTIANYSLQDKITLTGNVKNVNEYMQAMDVFVLPSWHEGLPYVVIEAQTSGLSCIVSEYVTKEVNITGNVEFLPIEESPNHWADCILKKTELKNNDREKWGIFMKETNFNIEKEASRLESILNKE